MKYFKSLRQFFDNKISVRLTGGFFLIVFLVVFIGIFAIVSFDTIRVNNNNARELLELENLLDDELVLVLSLIETDDRAEYAAIKSQIEDTRVDIDVLHKKNDQIIHELSLEAFDIIISTFNKISNRIIATHQEKLVLDTVFDEKVMTETELRRAFREPLLALKNIDLTEDVADLQYKSKEGLYQYRDKEHIDEWLESIAAVKDNYLVRSLPHTVGIITRYEETAQDLGYVAIDLQKNREQALKQIVQLKEMIKLLKQAEPILINSIETKSRSLERNMSGIFFFIIAASIVIAVIVGLMIFRSIVVPIEQLYQTASSIAQGNLKKRVDIQSDNEIGHLAQSFNQMADKLVTSLEQQKEVDKMKTEFIYIVSHQLRTPLTAIRGNIEFILEEPGRMTQEQLDDLGQVKIAGDRMSKLINDLLNVSRLETGVLNIDPRPADIEELINTVIKENKIIIADHGCNVEVSGTEKLPDIPVDRTLFEEVVGNLITNAVSYSKKNACGTIRIAVEKRTSDYMISVADSGIGIPQDAQSKVFSKFYRADNARVAKAGGSGVGLYIVKVIAEAAGGTIWFNSKKDEGSTFYFTIPLDGMKRQKGEKNLSQY